ncbi:hypothetical protein [Candidatus Poriferisodalis sp.]|uniref:hypothetical protein n=1 Tax=Candidatus Poriferisodalis sp. TaxID=3101277 RepID=UPI003B522E06
MTRTYEFSVFAEGADLTVASTVEQLERAGYTHPAAAASAGIQALVFSRTAERLADAVEAAASDAECIAGVRIARNVRSGAVAVFDPVTMEPMDLDADATPTDPTAAMPARPQRRIGRFQHIGSPLPLR